jgi:hydrogenase maturation protease
MSLLILALGNDLLGDDGVGLLAADALEQKSIPGAKVAKSALSGLYLVDLVEGFDDLVVVDSVVGDKPGEVVQLSLSEMGPRIVPSAHYLGLPEALELARRAGMRIPNRVAIVAMQIGGSQVIGEGVSAEVRRGIPALVKEVMKVAAQWGYGSSRESDSRSTAKKAKAKGRRLR